VGSGFGVPCARNGGQQYIPEHTQSRHTSVQQHQQQEVRLQHPLAGNTPTQHTAPCANTLHCRTPPAAAIAPTCIQQHCCRTSHQHCTANAAAAQPSAHCAVPCLAGQASAQFALTMQHPPTPNPPHLLSPLTHLPSALQQAGRVNTPPAPQASMPAPAPLPRQRQQQRQQCCRRGGSHAAGPKGGLEDP
jgi:hypothetical protein